MRKLFKIYNSKIGKKTQTDFREKIDRIDKDWLGINIIKIYSLKSNKKE